MRSFWGVLAFYGVLLLGLTGPGSGSEVWRLGQALQEPIARYFLFGVITEFRLRVLDVLFCRRDSSFRARAYAAGSPRPEALTAKVETLSKRSKSLLKLAEA